MTVPEAPQYDLADYLRKRRKVAEWTQEELAEASGVGVSTIRQIETRVVARPDLDTLIKLATALKRDVNEFLAQIPGMQSELPSETALSRFPTRRATDAGISLRAREMAEAYDDLPPLAQIAIDAIMRAFKPPERGRS